MAAKPVLTNPFLTPKIVGINDAQMAIGRLKQQLQKLKTVDLTGGGQKGGAEARRPEEMAKKLQARLREAASVLLSIGNQGYKSIKEETPVKEEDERPEDADRVWKQRVLTEVFYPAVVGEVISYEWRNNAMHTPTASEQVDYKTPLSHWFVSKALKTSRIAILYTKPAGWLDTQPRCVVYMNVLRRPYFLEGLTSAAELVLLANGLTLKNFTAPVQRGDNRKIVAGSPGEPMDTNFGDAHLEAVKIFISAVEARRETIKMEHYINNPGTSAEAREQFVMLQVRQTRVVALAKAKLSEFRYSTSLRQLYRPKDVRAPRRGGAAIGMLGLSSWSDLLDMQRDKAGMRANQTRNPRRLRG